MGANVQWNATTGTLNFGAATQPPPPTEVLNNFPEVVPAYDVSNSTRVGTISDISMGGIRYNDNILRFVNESSTRPRVEHSRHNLGGRFTVLSGTLGRIDGGGSHAVPRVINFIGDGRLLRSFEFSETDPPREITVDITVDITGVTHLRIEFVAPESTSWNPTGTVPYALVNATVR